MSFTVTWRGHATFSFDIDGASVVVDPFFAGDNPAARTRVDQVAADFILLTHGHGDHIADALPLARRTGAKVIANVEVARWIARHGHENVHGMNIGGSRRFPFGQVKMAPALHSSCLPDESYSGLAGGFIVAGGGKTVYVAGDTALFSDMALIGREGLDAAILPIGDNYTMGQQDALLALEYLQPSVVIPCHYNTWPVIAVDVEAWAEQVRRTTRATPIVLQVDRPYAL